MNSKPNFVRDFVPNCADGGIVAVCSYVFDCDGMKVTVNVGTLAQKTFDRERPGANIRDFIADFLKDRVVSSGEPIELGENAMMFHLN